MQSTNLKFKINNLKEVLANFGNEQKQLIGVTLIRENSSDNWLFNTPVDLNSIVPTICSALQQEIAQLEAELAPILEEEARQKAIQDEIDRLAKEQADLIAQQQAEIQAKRDQRKQYQDIGAAVIEQYLYDNSELVLNAEQTIQQLKKFSAAKELLELGSLRVAKELIIASEVDEIFTQERKDKYIQMLTR